MADHITGFQTNEGVKKYDYNSLANLPSGFEHITHVTSTTPYTVKFANLESGVYMLEGSFFINKKEEYIFENPTFAVVTRWENSNAGEDVYIVAIEGKFITVIKTVSSVTTVQKIPIENVCEILNPVL